MNFFLIPDYISFQLLTNAFIAVRMFSSCSSLQRPNIDIHRYRNHLSQLNLKCCSHPYKPLSALQLQEFICVGPFRHSLITQARILFALCNQTEIVCAWISSDQHYFTDRLYSVHFVKYLQDFSWVNAKVLYQDAFYELKQKLKSFGRTLLV